MIHFAKCGLKETVLTVCLPFCSQQDETKLKGHEAFFYILAPRK